MFSKINMIKTFDKVFGKLLSQILIRIIPPRKNSNNRVHNILIIRPGGIGDAVLLLPAIQSLKNSFPISEIHILAEKRNSGIFKFCTDISKLYLYDDIKNFDLLRLYNNKYDIVIDTEQWHTLNSVIAYSTRAPVRVGFDTNKRSKLFTDSIKYSQDDYEAQSFLNLVSKLIDEKKFFNPDRNFIVLEEKNYQFADELQKLKNNCDSVVGLFYGATVNERKWNIYNYFNLANKLIDRNIGVVLVGGNSDLRQLDKFLKNVRESSNFVNFVGKTNLEETANIISETDLFISCDSGLMHLAYGLGVKTLSLFGAGIQSKWGPRGKDSHIINKDLFCSPCTKFGYTPKCPYGVKCLSDISFEEVYEKAVEVLGF